MVIAELIFMLFVILIAAEVFTNALEHLGERLKISEGVTGSLFAAVGTALPETMVPLLAIFAGTGNTKVNEEIGVGAILGAPLMLSTLSIFLMALSVAKKRGLQGHFNPERTGFTRDLNFFLGAFVLSGVALFVPHDTPLLRGALAFTMVLIYFVYIMLTLRASAELVKDGHATEAGDKRFLARIGLPQHMATIILQLALGLGLLVGGAEGDLERADVGHVEQIRDRADRGFRNPAVMLFLHPPQDRNHRRRLAAFRIFGDLRFGPGKILRCERKVRGLQFLWSEAADGHLRFNLSLHAARGVGVQGVDAVKPERTRGAEHVISNVC